MNELKEINDLKKIQELKKEIKLREKELQQQLKINQSTKTNCRNKLAQTRKKFLVDRKDLSKKFTALNALVNTKSPLKNLAEFKEISVAFLLSVSEIENSLDKFLKALENAEESGL
jgi:hypothetical protein